jgi:rfaE bifunctional protein kinase chain/domain
MNLIDKVRSVSQSAKKPAILVIGDLMVDHYIWGGATRLSPEAPVPVVNVKNETYTLGGAGNLAQNLVSLGADVTLAGVIGNDAAGEQFTGILQQEGLKAHIIIKDDNRPTTLKTRVLAGSQQLVRIDRELTDELGLQTEDELMQKLSSAINNADMVVLSDYKKGLFSPRLTQRIIKAANDKQIRVVVDPKGLDFSKYKGAFIIKPNRKELAKAAKTDKINTINEVQDAAKIIFAQTSAAYIIVTLSEEGMAIVTEQGCQLLPVKATEVFDVTGAGDTVLATIAYFIASGLSVAQACELANHAAAIVIRHLGSATTTIDEIIKDIINDNLKTNPGL